MPVGPVDGKGTVLYYEDSGAPEGTRDYATLVLVHGTQFHSGVFRKMIPFASACKLRLVLVNSRDYPGSTRYSPEELDGLSSPQKEVQAATIRTRGLEFAAFMRWFIEVERIPPILEKEGASRPSGGISLLGWSSGNLQTIPLLTYANDLPQDTAEVLEGYFRSFFIHDISETAIGAPALEGLYTPMRDKSLNAEQIAATFPLWVSSYFTQAVVTSDTDAETPGFGEMVVARTARHQSDPDPRWVPTVVRMGPEGVAAVSDASVMPRSQVRIQLVNPAVYEDNLRRALFKCETEDGSGAKKAIWPKLRVNVVWCDMSTGSCVYATHRVMHMAKAYQEQGKGRTVEFHRLEQANHFVHWDEPERFVEFLSRII
ncbi:hypothetical protein IEO21_04220 [Rhodonia placenta]|uniref:AB hydrolase-1 domain-containing protein n=1 Tax=Rhodonia placenta TaxID=104341 RepID=A0A8H7U3F4_9APHY|nr:hypothetical protein IEO21_04220 [Postia placenta]